MKRCSLLTIALISATSPIVSAQSLSINGTSYAGFFGPANSVTVTPPAIPDNTPLSVTLGGSASGSLNSYWSSATATGGAVLGSNPIDIGPIVTPEVRVLASGAQVSLSGSSLDFKISEALSGSLLGGLVNAGSLGMTWKATSTLTQLILQPNTTYSLSFDVNASNGLLNSTLGISPSLTFRLLDGPTNAVSSGSSGTLVNVGGLSLVGAVGAPAGTGRATVQFTTGNTVSGQAARLEFNGAATIPATVLGLGTQFASISNVAINTVPETSTFGLALIGGVIALRRRR